MSHEDSTLARREWAAETARCLRMLPEKQATALRLRYNHGLSTAEIAQWLRTSHSDIEAAIAQGMRRLADLLQRDTST